MKPTLAGSSKIAKYFLPDYFIWELSPNDNAVYLTFDDGPTPELTNQILEILSIKKVKATFFIVGENVQKHPKLFQKIIDNNHCVGNHTFNHLKGWDSSNISYLKNILKASNYIPSNLFRPPYGKLSLNQAKSLTSRFKIIMWSILSYDYDKTVTAEECLSLSLDVKPGDIVVFHDNVKSSKNMLYSLPKFIDFCLAKGYHFKTINEGLSI